ncbi:MAG: hypothetical protein EBU34_11295, partial [Alphaproteobacteria bacterium]|nr:hypothetical protein [Alphaproteobacteria bacterium]
MVDAPRLFEQGLIRSRLQRAIRQGAEDFLLARASAELARPGAMMINWVVPEQVAGLALWPLAVLIVVLVALNVINNRVAPQTHYLLWAFAFAVVGTEALII